MYKLTIREEALRNLEGYSAKLFKQIAIRILKLSQDPRPPGYLKLRGSEGYRIRSGKYRILYTVDDEDQTVNVYRIEHRKDVYD
jgi:mRNA interferase RelE/StbE